MKIDLTPILQAIIALLAAFITAKVIPWISARTTKEQKANLKAVILTLVYAAEQIYGANHGSEKLDYVVDWLDKHGYKADRAEIEAAVYEAFNQIPLMNGSTLLLPDSVDVDITHWTLEQLRSFCDLNGIETTGCLTREDYMDVIERGGRVSDQPPGEAAEGREEVEDPDAYLQREV